MLSLIRVLEAPVRKPNKSTSEETDEEDEGAKQVSFQSCIDIVIYFFTGWRKERKVKENFISQATWKNRQTSVRNGCQHPGTKTRGCTGTYGEPYLEHHLKPSIVFVLSSLLG